MPEHEAEVKFLFLEIDIDGSGEMDLAEFSRMMTNPTSRRQELLHNRIVEMRESFLLFDADRSGEVDLGELHLWLTRYGNRDSIEQVQAIVEQAGADEDGDGTLDFREFIKVLNGPPTVLSRRINSQLGELRKLFRFFDPEHTGWVNAERLRRLFHGQGKLFPNTILEDFLSVIRQAVKALDENFQKVIFADASPVEKEDPKAAEGESAEEGLTEKDSTPKVEEDATLGFAEFILSIGVEAPSQELSAQEAANGLEQAEDDWGGRAERYASECTYHATTIDPAVWSEKEEKWAEGEEVPGEEAPGITPAAGQDDSVLASPSHGPLEAAASSGPRLGSTPSHAPGGDTAPGTGTGDDPQGRVSSPRPSGTLNGLFQEITQEAVERAHRWCRESFSGHISTAPKDTLLKRMEDGTTLFAHGLLATSVANLPRFPRVLATHLTHSPERRLDIVGYDQEALSRFLRRHRGIDPTFSRLRDNQYRLLSKFAIVLDYPQAAHIVTM